MKRIFFILSAMFLMVSCNQKNNQPSVDVKTDTANINVEGVTRLPQQGFELICIQDHDQSMDPKLFSCSDAKLLEDLLAKGAPESSINVFLLSDGNHNYIVDAGLGADKGGLLLQKLQALHVDPNKVDAVFITHLHPDHIGGMVYNKSAAFPNAQIYISTEEFNAWTNGVLSKGNGQIMDMLSYYALNVNLFNDGDTLAQPFVDESTGETFPVVAHLAKGHTPGHALLTVGQVLLAGDLLHAINLQLEHPEICCQFDFDKKSALDARVKWLDYAKTNHLILAGAHLPAPHYVQF